jgi:hypothetical protein
MDFEIHGRARGFVNRNAGCGNQQLRPSITRFCSTAGGCDGLIDRGRPFARRSRSRLRAKLPRSSGGAGQIHLAPPPARSISPEGRERPATVITVERPLALALSRTAGRTDRGAPA